MTNQPLEDLYSQIFDLLYPEIQNQKRGVLHTVIYIILEEKSQADLICNHFNITEFNTLNDDQKIVENLMFNIKGLDKYNPIKKITSFFVRDEGIRLDEKYIELSWIVVIACVLIGAYFSLKYIEGKKKENKKKQYERVATTNVQATFPPSQPIPQPLRSCTAALCLVVPAFLISNLRRNNLLNAPEIEELLDNVSYFLCTTIEDANLKQMAIEITDEVIPTNNNQEFYIRIHIADGQEMINKEATYFLKTNLPSHGKGVIKQIAYLRNLSGLEKFNRV